MALVNVKDMMQAAREGHYAIGAFNTNNLEWTKAILETAEEQKSPVIIEVSEGATKYMGGYKVVADLVRDLFEAKKITVPVALHLDHGTYEGAKAALKAGFTSVMFDGSALPLEENIAKTKEIVTLAHFCGATVEAEVGAIGGEEDGVKGRGEVADPDQCKLIADLGIDMLAAGIGNIHGPYPANWLGLDFDCLAAIKAKCGDMPLVLHGGTGIPEDQVKKAISLGVCKVNVNTECQQYFAAATRKYIEEGKDLEKKGYDPRKLLKPGFEGIKEIVAIKMAMFGSVNKAN